MAIIRFYLCFDLMCVISGKTDQSCLNFFYSLPWLYRMYHKIFREIAYLFQVERAKGQKLGKIQKLVQKQVLQNFDVQQPCSSWPQLHARKFSAWSELVKKQVFFSFMVKNWFFSNSEEAKSCFYPYFLFAPHLSFDLSM